VETRSIYVKHHTVARTGHLFSAETCSFSVQTCSFFVETRAFSVEYLLVLYDGGEEEKIKSQRNLVARGLKGTLKNSLIIHEENTKKNHKRIVSVYVIQIHVDLHKL
jgi:hypothetical protein